MTYFGQFKDDPYYMTDEEERRLEEREMGVMGRKVTVCDACERASCWQGEFYCDYAKMAGTKKLTVRELHQRPRGENAEYWFKDGNGVIDHLALEEFRTAAVTG